MPTGIFLWLVFIYPLIFVLSKYYKYFFPSQSKYSDFPDAPSDPVFSLTQKMRDLEQQLQNMTDTPDERQLEVKYELACLNQECNSFDRSGNSYYYVILFG